MNSIVIERLKTVVTAPEGTTLVVVKIVTSQDGLYGLGCATFTQRALAVATILEDYLGPMVVGRDVADISDIFARMMVSGYWRNGPEINAAIAGVDMALWDIKGKIAGLPCYSLWGGKARGAVAVYRHADGRDPIEVGDHVQYWMEQGVHYIRCQMGGYGGNISASSEEIQFADPHVSLPRDVQPGAYFDPDHYRRQIPRLFELLRVRFGTDIHFLHDVHERLSPDQVIKLAHAVEPYDLFFLEDPLPPEHIEWFAQLRARTIIPLAMGELFTHPMEWKPLVTGRLIDYIRVHISQIGGITPALRLAILCDAMGIRTAWHGPGDVSPVGHAANVHLDMSMPNFGIQEWSGITERLRAVFPGAPELLNGYVYPSDQPGLGIDLDENEAAKYPPQHSNPTWTIARLPDGTMARP